MADKAKILVVDDEPLVLKTMRKLLELQGYLITTADSGEEALKQAKWFDFDLVLSDIRMPGMNGVRTVEEIQKIYARSEKKCRYLFFTGFAEDEAVEEAVLLCNTEIIVKPLDVPKLLHIIARELSEAA